jgi:hypothetical protein
VVKAIGRTCFREHMYVLSMRTRVRVYKTYVSLGTALPPGYPARDQRTNVTRSTGSGTPSISVRMK